MTHEGLNLGKLAEAKLTTPVVAADRYPSDLPEVMDAVMNHHSDLERIAPDVARVALPAASEAQVFTSEASNVVVRGLPS